MLGLLSGFGGRRVLVAGRFPLRVEWTRASIDYAELEKTFTARFGDVLQQPRNVFDIGASLGEWSALAATLVGPDKVHVFEPNRASWRHIQRVFELNRLAPPAGFFGGFVGGEDRFKDGDCSWATNRQWPRVQEGTVIFESLLKPEDLPIITLDSYCRRTGVMPGVVKIDVEGSEGQVLRGGENVLREAHPLLFLSLHPWALADYGDSKDSLLAYLASLGYRAELLGIDHEEHWLFS